MFSTQGPGKTQKLQVLFEDWLDAEEDWGHSKLVLQMKQQHTMGRRGSRQWLTRMQIEEKYRSAMVAADIIAQKEAMDEPARSAAVRDHPDTPLPEMKQYLVFDAESEYDQEDTVLESLFKVPDGGKGSSSDRKGSKRRRSSSSSSSEDSQSDESESSSDKKKSKKSKKDKKSKKNKDKKKKKSKGKKGKKTKEERQKEKKKLEEKEAKEQERQTEKAHQKSRQEAKKVRVSI